MNFKTKLYINGEWVLPKNCGTFKVMNPATGSLLTECSNATAEDVDKAVAAARKCLEGPSWGFASTGTQRATVLRKLGEIIAARKDEIANLDTLDMGKPIREALADVVGAIAACAHFAQLAERQDMQQFEKIANGTDDFNTNIVYEPVGVVGAITPWNFPFLMGIWKVVPAIAAGCCVVLKPSEFSPLSCLLLGEMCTQAGLPAGALNVLPGLGASAGGALSCHPGVDKVSFTGSAATGRHVMKAAALGPRAISLELGGKSPLLVFDDADLDSAVDWILTGILWGSGQVCSATSRVLVQSGVRKQLCEKLYTKLRLVRLGPSLPVESEEETKVHGGQKIGPVVSKAQYDRIWGFIDEAKADGLTITIGGTRPETGGKTGRLAGGYYIPATVIEDPPTTSRVWKEEIFGPVLCIREFSTEEQGVTDANDTEYGLAAAVFSADEARCRRISRALRTGIVWTNCAQPAFITAPWGGVKGSGFGRALGRWGLEEFTSVKQVTSCAPGYSWGLW